MDIQSLNRLQGIPNFNVHTLSVDINVLMVHWNRAAVHQLIIHSIFTLIYREMSPKRLRFTCLFLSKNTLQDTHKKMASIGLDSCLNPWLFLLGLVGDKIFPVYIFNTIEKVILGFFSIFLLCVPLSIHWKQNAGKARQTPSRPNLLSPRAKVASASSRGEKLQRAYNNLK